MGTHVVLQELKATDRVYQPGQLVDASGWPNIRALIATRRVRERTVSEASQDAAVTLSQIRPIREKGKG